MKKTNTNRMENNILPVIRAIEQNDSFILLTHTKPDGDAVGSLLALHLALENIGKKVTSYTDPPPETYRFLSGFEKLKNVDEFENPGKNIIIILDSSNIDRCPISNLENAENILNIDHHLDNSGFGNINYVDSSASSTGILIYRLLTKIRLVITPDIAENLYTAENQYTA